MKKERKILHFDMDYFFAQIEERENPHFSGKPIVVGADPKKGRGVVSSASYEARKYGIKSGMPISKAYQLCPQAIFLPPNFELYEKVTQRIMEIAKKYSQIYEIVSLDEAYLDISFCKTWSEAKKLGKKLKKEIFEKERLNCTVGIGPNKLIAKLASKKGKPNGLLVVLPGKVQKFLENLDVGDLPGIGPKKVEILNSIGVYKVSQLKNIPKEKLKEMFGKVGERIYEMARGIDKEPVVEQKIVKSVGKQMTFEKDLKDAKIIFEKFEQLFSLVFEEAKNQSFCFKTIVVICRFSDFKTIQKSKTFKNKNLSFEDLKRYSKRLLLECLIKNPKKAVRLVGLRLKI